MLDNKYFEFSSVVEAPVTGLMTEEEFVEHYTRMYGELQANDPSENGMRARMERARLYGTSSLVGGPNKDGIEEWLKGETLNTYGDYDEELEEKTGDGYVSKWPGLEAFKQEWFGEDDDSDEVVGLRDKVNPVDG